MYYKCHHCGAYIEEDYLGKATEIMDRDVPNSEWEYNICPYCGSDDIGEAKECPTCGEPIDSDVDFCDDCFQSVWKTLMSLVDEYSEDADEEYAYELIDTVWVAIGEARERSKG